jgi:hypothetical protein
VSGRVLASHVAKPYSAVNACAGRWQTIICS